jgi:hypothetical protein
MVALFLAMGVASPFWFKAIDPTAVAIASRAGCAPPAPSSGMPNAAPIYDGASIADDPARSAVALPAIPGGAHE